MPIPEMKFKSFDPSEPVEIRLLKEKVEALPDSYYKDDTCFEISKEVFNYCKSEINFKVITANQKHGDHFPIKKA